MKKGKNLRKVAMLQNKPQNWRFDVSWIERSKTLRYLPGAKTAVLQYLIPCLKKEPVDIIIHIDTNDSPCKAEDFLYQELVNVRETITKFHPNCKNIVISSPIVRTNQKEANNILKKYSNILKQEGRNFIFSQQQQHRICTGMACT